MRTNPLKARLKAGKKCLGAWLAANNPIIAEAFALAGYDFVIIDHEHGPGDYVGAMQQLMALRSGGGANAPSPVIRVPWHDPIYIKRSLDIGMEGIMVPNVEDADVADAMVRELDLYGAVDSQPAAIDDDGLDVALQLGLRLVAGDLTKHDLAGFQLVTIDGAERRTFMVGGGDPELTLEATSFEALRLLGSRRTDDELRAARFSGDLDRYLPGLVHMDLPTTSLGEHRSTR
jgi:hypothetical protein